MKKILTIAFVLSVIAAEAVPNRVIRKISYSKESEKCVLDLRLPEGVTNFATIVSLHGGGLVAGGRDFGAWPKEGKDEPIAAVAVEYRLLKKGSEVTPANCIDDAAAAVAWTLDNIASYGGDPKKVFVTGISAGGYLTAMVGLDERWLKKYNHRRDELAGIIPFTGQMTKHFNVRAVGFNDKDPQYAPKVDEWAPLFYAGAKGIPPVSFVCGGRDEEWKGRVEETELLAEALRDCGNRKVEFHETEGSHGGGILESAYFLRDFIAKYSDTGIVGRFAPGERVAFFGDSITHGGSYIGYLQLFAALRNPGSDVRLLNCGISGDSARGGTKRFQNDLMKMKPDRVFVMFGMNDVGRDNYATVNLDEKTAAERAKSLAHYEKNQRELVGLMAKAKVKAVMMTPSPYDQYSRLTNANNLVACNEPGLAACADIVRRIAGERNLGTVEMHRTLTELQKANADVVFANDRVHPGRPGHLLMAAQILEAMGYSPIVARAVVDAKKKSFVPVHCNDWGSRNCRVTGVTANAKGVAFNYAPKALPLPAIAEYAVADRYYPLTSKFNQEIIAVKNLPAGNYKVSFDGQELCRATAAELEKGINVALLKTPNQALAVKASKWTQELVDMWNRLRYCQLIVAKIEAAKVDSENAAAADKWLDDWLEREKNSRWIGAFRGWAKTYRETRDHRDEIRDHEENLRQQLNAVRPVISRVEVSLISKD